MPAVRGYMASGYYNGRIYLVGGFDGAVVANSVWEYDPVADTWNTALLAMPHPIHSAGYGIINGHFYVAGGSDNDGSSTYGGLWDYNIAANTWTQRASLPTSLQLPGSGVINGQLWLFGGATGSPFTPTYVSQFYDPASDVWTSGPTLNEARSFIAGTTIGNTLIAAGGYAFGGYVRSVETLGCGDCNTGSWSVKAEYPAQIESPAAGTDGIFVYSAGGLAAGTQSNGFYRYDPLSNTWATLPPLPIALYATRGAYAASTNSFYVFGGYDGNVVLFTTYKYDFNTNVWSTGANMPAGRYFPNVSYFNANGKIYVIGGFDANYNEVNQTWEYDPVANSWDTTLANIPVAMAGSATSIVGQFIYLAGSWNDGSGSGLHNRYDIINNSWADLAAAPVPIYAAVGGAIGGRIYMVGGGSPFRPQNRQPDPAGLTGLLAPSASYNTTYIYDIGNNSWTTGPTTNVPHSFAAGVAVGARFLSLGGFNGSGDTNIVESLNVVCPNCASFFESFDTSGPQTLPTGWNRANAAGPAPFWELSTTTPDSGTKDMFIDDPAAVSDKRLDTPPILITSDSAQVSFRNFYNLEGNDGGVLEVSSPSINGGAFTDITDPAVGGSFVAGGYNGVISGGSSNPLAGRMVWSQSSKGYISTVANLGPNVGRQTIKLRFRMGSDSSGSAPGWRIDRFAVTPLKCPTILFRAVSRKVHGGAGAFDIELPLTGSPGVECRSGAVPGTHQIVLTFAHSVAFSGVSVTAGTGSAAASVNGTEVTVDLTGVANAQTITVTLANADDGINSGDVTVPMRVLASDVNANGLVNATDVSQAKIQSGQPVTTATFRTDVNASGSINSSDISIIKSQSGIGLQ